ncbi:NTPase [Singapore grouper iridovirus]|nr:NTPase [Singapore grouper iridovirus]
MDISPYDFLQLYPWLNPEPDEKDTLLDAFPQTSFEQALAAKPELVAAATNDPKFGHQKLIELYMSEETPYREVLLFHAPGTGKTCTVVKVVERVKAAGLMKGCLVLARGVQLLKNFVQELVFSCDTKGKYIPEGYADMTEQEKSRKIKRAVSGFYQFKTYETFAKMAAKTGMLSLQTQYDKFVIIMDEVHHLKSVQTEGINTYNSLFRFMHGVKGCIKILLSGTPMSNTPGELADIFNLILPRNLLIKPDEGIFSQAGDLLNPAELAKRVRGRISYLKAAQPDTGLTYVGGVLNPPLTHFKVVSLKMSPFQTEAYRVAWNKDFGDRNIFSNSRQSALAVLPNGAWGPEADHRSKQEIMTMSANLGRYSCKYAYALNVAETSSKTFVYCEYVNGSGLQLFADLLRAAGWKAASGRENTRGKRFAVLTAAQRNIHLLVKRFNAEDNLDGDYIRLLLGSRVVAEGLTFKEVRNTIILTPHWNYTETAQAIARSWRAGSHDRLRARGEDVQLFVHRLVAVPDFAAEEAPSIDLDMYKVSEGKDKKIKTVERLLMKTAQDCALLKFRNLYSSAYNGSRDCEYRNCAFKCTGISDTLPAAAAGLAAEENARTVDLLRTKGGVDPNYLQSDLSYVWSLVASGATFPNKWGDAAVLRATNGRLELSTPYSSTDGGVWGDFYKTRQLCYAKLNPAQLSQDRLRTELPEVARALLTTAEPRNIGEIASNMPEHVQTLLLTSCIAAKQAGHTKNQARRDAVLQFYKGFYTKGPSGWVVWLFARGPAAQVLDESTMTWNNADEATLKYLNDRQRQLINNPIGYYGLFNPNLKDFCIRDVTKRSATDEDLRKLTVGRRCVDWDQRTLTHIIVRLMKINGRDDFLPDATLSELRAAVRRDPHHKPEDLEDRESCRRFLFWTQKGDNKFRRQDICKAMEKWFSENDLMEDNFDCGHQHKKRSKFA